MEYHPAHPVHLPDAIESGVDYVTAPTYNQIRPADIPQDFRIFSTGTTITVPEGANYLILGFVDSYYADNSGTQTVKGVPADPPVADAGPDQNNGK